MPKSRPEIYAEMLEQATEATLKAAAAVPEAKRLKQLQAGKSHPLWLVGHLANTTNLLLNMWCCEGGNLLPKELHKKLSPDFAGGDPIVPDAANYPAWDEILNHYRDVQKACADGIRKLTDAELDGPLRGGAPEAMNERFGPVEKCIRAMMSHDAHHRGQMAMIGALD